MLNLHSAECNHQVPTLIQATPEIISDATFANKIVRFIKSNAIVLIKDGRSIDLGPSQPSL